MPREHENNNSQEQEPRDAVRLQTHRRALRGRKATLVLLLTISALLPLLFLRYDEPTRGLQAVKVLAKAGSLTGTVLLVWQLVLGVRVVSTLFHKDLLWLVQVHERLGMLAIPLITLHPIFITIYYAWTSRRAVWAIDMGYPFCNHSQIFFSHSE